MQETQTMPTLTPPKTRIPLPLDEIAALCRKYDVEELSVFGSILRDDFGPDSDVDFLVTFRPESWPDARLEQYFGFQDELTALLDRRVELAERKMVEASENYIRRASILRTAESIYAS